MMLSLLLSALCVPQPDILNVKRRIAAAGKRIKVIAKIERQEALDNMESIIAEADGIMVARGDLGIEINTERLPVVQKHLISRANSHGKLVITAYADAGINDPESYSDPCGKF